MIPPCTSRIRFREWRTDDLEEFHSICADPEVMQFVGDGQAWPRLASQQFIDRAVAQFAECGYCQWALEDDRQGRLMGYCGFAQSDTGSEIGWRLGSPYWGQGLATEAARAVVRFGFESLRFERIVATVQANNRASIRVIEKLGMHPERQFQRQGREILAYVLTQPSDAVDSS